MGGKTFFSLTIELQLFAFSDARFGNLCRDGSMGSCASIRARAKSKSGDVTCAGHYVDSSSRRISRVCRPSLASDAIALGGACDFVMWLRILVIDVTTGTFAHDLVEPDPRYKLITSFEESPSAENAKAEILDLLSLKDDLKLYDLRGGSVDEPTVCSLLFPNSKVPDVSSLEYLCRLLMLSDSANCYGAILSGHPKTGDRCVRIQLSFILDFCR